MYSNLLAVDSRDRNVQVILIIRVFARQRQLIVNELRELKWCNIRYWKFNHVARWHEGVSRHNLWVRNVQKHVIITIRVSGGSRIFPRKRHQLLGGGAPNIRFGQIFPKTAWNWKNLDPKGGHAFPPRNSLDPPLRVLVSPLPLSLLTTHSNTDKLPFLGLCHLLRFLLEKSQKQPLRWLFKPPKNL